MCACRVAVTGATGGIGRRIVERLAASPEVTQVLLLDQRARRDLPDKVEQQIVDLRRPAATPDLEGIDTLVHLPFAASAPRRRDGTLATTVTRNLLAGASAADVRHLVVLSSATVYGAWPNNPVPITEVQPLRPVPEFAYAVGHAEVEQLVVD